MALDKKRVEQLALENGFKLKQQEDGSMALNAYVFEFADKLITETIGELAKAIGAGKDTVLLVEAVARIKDLMEGDDGQAWKEARKFLEKLEKPAPAYKCPAPEGYVQPPEPEFGDGCDYEGFPGGCARMGCKPPPQDQYLCQAWGETDLPVVAIVEGLDKVSAFLVENWLGDEDATNDDGTKALPAAMQEMQDEWAQEGEAWKWEIAFEIGGVSVQKVGRAAQGSTK